MNHNWYIDENHVMYWDGKPYIPNGLAGPILEKDITLTYSYIDKLIKKNIYDFAIVYEGDSDKISKTWTTEEYNDWINKTTDYLTKKGATYIFVLQPSYLVPSDSPRDTAYFNQADVKKQIIGEMKRFEPLVTKEGLRGLMYYWEINTPFAGYPPVAPDSESGFNEFRDMLNNYGKSMKNEIGDLPILIRFAGELNYIPYLYTLSGEYIDGIVAQYNQFTPDDLKSAMSDSPFIRAFNTFNKTKLMWVNLQISFGTKTTWPPYVLKDILCVTSYICFNK